MEKYSKFSVNIFAGIHKIVLILLYKDNIQGVPINMAIERLHDHYSGNFIL